MKEMIFAVVRRPLIFKFVLAVFFLIGFCGILWNPSFFIPLSAFHLLLSLSILLIFSPAKNQDFIRFCLLVATVGFGIEVVGVRTGKVFGQYYYGAALGFKAGAVPLVIAANWLMLTLCSLSFVEPFFKSTTARVISGALVMVSLDFLIEPLCSRLDFWHWQDGVAPLRNFIAWFLVSLFFHSVASNLRFVKHNAIASFLLLMQFLFFGGLLLANFLFPDLLS